MLLPRIGMSARSGVQPRCAVWTRPKTVKRKVQAHERGELDEEHAGRAPVAKNTDGVRALVAEQLRGRHEGSGVGQAAAARSRLPATSGSPRNFRRVVAAEKRAWRAVNARQQRPAVWVPGETLVIDWGTLPGGIKVFCAVLAWCRVRFVRFARDETAATTMALLAECFETLGGVPAKVLADRMGCVKGGVVAFGGDPDTGLRAVRHALRVPRASSSSGAMSERRSS